MKVELDHSEINTLIQSLEILNIVLQEDNDKELLDKLNIALPLALDEFTSDSRVDFKKYLEACKTTEDAHYNLRINLDSQIKNFKGSIDRLRKFL